MSNWNFQAIQKDMAKAWRLFWDPKVPLALKIVLPIAALVYWIFPIDLIPGIPLDDIAILVLALRLFVQLASPKPAAAPPAPTPDDDENTIETSWRVIKDNG
jgi:uncharacterized membrane protein YkvA (DUF1232 family)